MSEPKNQISFEQAGLATILSRNQLTLPANQREYAWEDRHVRALMSDLAKAISDDDADYFLGTIVTIPRADNTLEVVDGQQRLATTSILLTAIRDYLEGRDDMVVQAINNDYLTGIDLKRRVRVPHLRLNIADRELFTWLVTRQGEKPAISKPSHRLIMEAYEIAQGQVKKVVSPHDPKNHADVLVKWVTFLADRALAVLVRVADDANAYRMFETLNDRGLRTSQADLIKNHLFGKAASRFAEVQDRWSSMRSSLESLSDEDITVTYLRHALTVQRGLVRESAVYDIVQDMAKSEEGALATATALDNLAAAYVATFNPEHERWSGYPDTVRRSIEVFNLLSIRPFRPLILAIASKFDKKETGLAYQYLVALSVRLILATGTTSGSIDELAASASLSIYQGKTTTTAALKKLLADITPSDEQFKAAVANVKVSQPKFARYYLRSMEMAAKGEAEPYFIPTDDRAVITLEHILPKNPGKNWPSFPADVADLYVNRLGNQLLMRASDNSGARSDSFDKKRALYAKSPYVLTKLAGEFATWDSNAVEERQARLAEIAVKTWRV